MLENIYTTKMSSNKKQLMKRFSKICSVNGQLCKIISAVITLFIAATMIFAIVVLASFENKDFELEIEIRQGDTVLNFENKPFVYNKTVYIPLRELAKERGLTQNEKSYITWNNGKIEMLLVEKTNDSEVRYLIYNFGIEIGKSEYTLNPAMKEEYKQKWNISNTKQMNNAPILKNGVTYIPFEFVEYLLNRSMTTMDITYSLGR